MSPRLQIYLPLLLTCSLFSFQGIAQVIIPRFEALGVNDGLPHSSVFSILQDKTGFMWFGTADGLCRYDGHSLKAYRYNAIIPGEVSNNFVRGKIQEDKQGNIWYCNQAGIYKWEKFTEKIKRLRPIEPSEFGNAYFMLVCLDSMGLLWMYNIKTGMCAYDENTGKIKRYKLPVASDYDKINLESVTCDNNENIKIHPSSKKNDFLNFNVYNRAYTWQGLANVPHAILFGHASQILSYDDKIIYRENFTGKCKIIPKQINKEKIDFISQDGIEDNYNRLWLTARGKGLMCFDKKYNQFSRFTHSNIKLKSLPFDLTTCLYIDRNDNLWIGMDGGGVARLDLKEPKFHIFPLQEGDYPLLQDYFTKCFYEDGKGRIWFGSQTNGLNIYDPVTLTLKNYKHSKENPHSLPGNVVSSIFCDREGNMWVGHNGGISLFEEKTASFHRIPMSQIVNYGTLVNNSVNKIIQLRNGDIMAASDFGVWCVSKNRQGKFNAYWKSVLPGFISQATDLLELTDSSLLLILPGQGLFHYTLQDGVYAYKGKYLSGLNPLSIVQDEKQKDFLWIGSGKGLLHVNTNNFIYTLYDERSGMANNYVYGALECPDGNLWLSTNNGLSHFSRAGKKFVNYTYLDGLQSNEFNTGAFYRSNTGNFYFGGIKGFNWFKPGYTPGPGKKPSGVITMLEINNEIFKPDSNFFNTRSLAVPYFSNEFNFHFAALDYTRPEANRVMYKLEGWESNWRMADNFMARYSHILPGKYKMRLRVSNAYGQWSDEENIFINIAPPWWKQNWFMVLMILITLTLLAFIVNKIALAKAQVKLRSLEKQVAIDAERNRISADMHDEIGSEITHIALLSELLQSQDKTATDLKKDIARISLSARQLVQTMSEIIWSLNPQNDSLENLLAYIREQSSRYTEALVISYEIYFPDALPDIKLSNLQRRNIYLVTREAINNALKHAACTSIILRLELNRENYCFSVSDNGKGISSIPSISGHNGIKNMTRRMTDIEGSFEVIALNPGTRVEYCMPLLATTNFTK